jgi:hypothetical protein
MAKISIQCRLDLAPPGKDGGPDFLQIGAASIKGWRTVAQKSGLLVEMAFMTDLNVRSDNFRRLMLSLSP